MRTVVDQQRFRAIAERQRAGFAAAEPFPHIVVDDLLGTEAAAAILREFPGDEGDWRYLHHVNEKKRILPNVTAMGSETRAVVAALQSPEFVASLEILSGIRPLVADPRLEGGGLGDMKPGAFLNVHRDYQSHPIQKTWSRQLNLILFLNPDWAPEHHGELELWDETVSRCVQRVEPRHNRCIIFHTGQNSFHGVPQPIACLPGASRKSLALYYFRDEQQARPIESTLYMPRPTDAAWQRALIRVDSWMVRAYTILKRYTPLRDDLASRILKRLWPS